MLRALCLWFLASIISASSGVLRHARLAPGLRGRLRETGPEGPEGPGSVELIVRTYAAELPTLLPTLLRSVELFWPVDWGVLVVLDAESAEDRLLGAQLPSYVRVIYEPAPRGYGRYGWARQNFGRGYLRAVYSFFLCDLYSKAEFAALIDADAVLTSGAQPNLLFDYSSGSMLPYMHGVRRGLIFTYAVEAALGVDITAEFMEGMPFVFRTSDLRALRAFMAKRLGFPQFTADFADVFLALHRETLTLCGNRSMIACLPCFHTIAGNFFFWSSRDKYAWSLLDVPSNIFASNGLQDRPYTCPALRGGVHVPYQGIWVSRGCGKACTYSRVSGRPWNMKQLDGPSVMEHHLHASAYIEAGRCAGLEANGMPCANLALPPCVFLLPSGRPWEVISNRLFKANTSLEAVFLSAGCGDRICAAHFDDTGCPKGRRLADLRTTLAHALALEKPREGFLRSSSRSGSMHVERTRPDWWPLSIRSTILRD